MKSIVSQEWVLEHLGQADVVIADCRFALGKPESGRSSYVEGHLPGAVYFDLEKDLSAPVGAVGGRHPLPDPQQLAHVLGQAGISSGTKVVAYDDQGGAMASRLWWLLQWMGHENAYVMDGGFSAWQAAGRPVTTEVPHVEAVQFEVNLQPSILVDVEGVRNREAGVVLIDSRELKRYLGEEEAIDKAAGHVPGAINAFWKDSLTAEGKWKSAEEQAARFEHLPKDTEVIVYCGSGVTATPNFMALTEAGFTNVKLYAGSWSDWISYSENPIATGEMRVGERDIVITRVLNAPRELVFEAWTNEEHLSKWWGPQGFTITNQKFELKPGGTWEFVMHGPDGANFPNTNIFVEIVKPERIVIKHDVFPHFTATATFEELNGKTKLTYSSVFDESAEVFDKVKTYAVPGAEQTMGRLEELLASISE